MRNYNELDSGHLDVAVSPASLEFRSELYAQTSPATPLNILKHFISAPLSRKSAAFEIKEISETKKRFRY